MDTDRDHNLEMHFIYLWKKKRKIASVWLSHKFFITNRCLSLVGSALTRPRAQFWCLEWRLTATADPSTYEDEASAATASVLPGNRTWNISKTKNKQKSRFRKIFGAEIVIQKIIQLIYIWVYNLGVRGSLELSAVWRVQLAWPQISAL